MTWFDLARAVLVTAAVVMVPGAGISIVLGFRGFALWALTIPAGVTTIAVAALGAPFLGITWGVLPVLLTAVAIAVVAAVLRLALFRPWLRLREGDRRLRTGVVLAIAAACAIVFVQVALAIGAPENISQTFDNIFHLNAVRYILDTGSASPMDLGDMTSAPSGGVPFYPSGWHALASVVVQISGVSIPVASNALTLFFAAVAWPVSILFLTRSLVGSSAPALITAAAVSAALPAFPLLMMSYGVLFPYLMALSVVPVPLALLIEAVRRNEGESWWRLLVAAVGTLPGIAIAHPGGFVALLAFGSFVLLVLWIRLLRSAVSRRAKLVSLLIAVLYVCAAVVSWYVLRPPAAARTWTTTETMGQAIGEIVTTSVWAAPVNVIVTALIVTGVVVAVRRHRMVDVLSLGLFAIAAGLYLVVSGLPYAELRDLLTGAWYNNAPRLAALLPIAWVPLAAVGGEALWRIVRRRSERLAGRQRILVPSAIAVVVLLVVPQVWVMRSAIEDTAANFAYSKDSPLLTSDEHALLERLDDETPADAVIIGSPWTGTALAYALSDRQVMMPHTLMDITKDMETILNGLDTATSGSAVCAAVDRMGADYVLDFGTQEVNGGEHPYRGLDRLSRSDAVKEVDSVGDAVLYEIVACG